MSSSDKKGKGRLTIEGVETVYISAGCNRYSNVADVREKDGLVAYGAGSQVCLWRSEDASSTGVHRTLQGNRGSVTTVKFLAAGSSSGVQERSGLVSGDRSGRLVIWREATPGADDFQEQEEMTLSSAVGACSVLRLDNGTHLLAVGTSDGFVSMYALPGHGVAELLEKISLKGKMPMDIGLSFLPRSKVMVMSIGGTDSKIHLYTRSPSSSTFSPTLSLPGHADWVRCLTFSAPLAATRLVESQDVSFDYKEGDLLLASGSQDNYIRLWRFTSSRSGASGLGEASGSASILRQSDGKSALDLLDDLDDGADGEIAAKQYTFSVNDDGNGTSSSFAVTSESVLLGHENWVTGLHWSPEPAPDTGMPQLLSASADRSMILWTQDAASSVWLTAHRFGEIGGTNLGFFGALFGSGGNTVLAHGWGGSFHTWRKSPESASASGSAQWASVVSVTGHYDEVTSLAWEPEGDYLVSVSADQTARLHAPWRRQRNCEEVEKKDVTWHELARPQIHGYDMEDVAWLSRTRFISGSEEKIVRVFDAPGTFVESMRTMGTSTMLANDGARPNAATVPALGLSNRAVYDSTATSELNGTASGASDLVTFKALTRPPFEEQLLTSTLWPETEKLYGHGYEINAIAASHSGQLVASACRSTNAEHAVIRLHRTDTWAQVLPPLAGHALTVTAIRFSPDDRYILSASRDRSWQLFERQEASQDGMAYMRVASTSKAHARIIWDCCWSLDGSMFATAARDKTVKLWKAREAEEGAAQATWPCIATLQLPDAATAVSFTELDGRSILAVGTEAGHIVLFRSDEAGEWSQVLAIDNERAHCATIRRLSWRPRTTGGTGLPLLASCSDDRSVRVLRIAL